MNRCQTRYVLNPRGSASVAVVVIFQQAFPLRPFTVVTRHTLQLGLEYKLQCQKQVRADTGIDHLDDPVDGDRV